jgi:hypothetical protein
VRGFGEGKKALVRKALKAMLEDKRRELSRNFKRAVGGVGIHNDEFIAPCYAFETVFQVRFFVVAKHRAGKPMNARHQARISFRRN